MRTPASSQTINSLKQNASDSIAELEAVFPDMMKLRDQLTAIGADDKERADTILAFFSKTEDMFIGSHFILHELMASLRLLLDTDLIYEKRYHIQNINLCIYEAHNYFVGDNDDGVWSLCKPYILSLNNPILQSYITILDNELEKLGSECNKGLRNSTAHYDKPHIRYDMLNSITDEDIYCKAVSHFMLIHLRISQLSTIVFAIISQITPNKSLENIEIEKSKLDIKALVEEKLVDTFSSNEELKRISSESLIKISDNIDSLFNKHLSIKRLKEVSSVKNTDIYLCLEILHQLILLRMIINFIRCDLTSSIRAYINSESSIEQSVHLRRIYLIEVAALTHLYGYNSNKRNSSLWQQLMALDVHHNEYETKSLQEELENMTSEIDSTHRNLHIHFREKERLNILKRYKSYKNLNQIAEISKAHSLISLCKKIEDYTMSVLTRVDQAQQKIGLEQDNRFYSMLQNLQNMTMQSKTSEYTKSQVAEMLNEMKSNFENIFTFKKR